MHFVVNCGFYTAYPKVFEPWHFYQFPWSWSSSAAHCCGITFRHCLTSHKVITLMDNSVQEEAHSCSPTFTLTHVNTLSALLSLNNRPHQQERNTM